MSRILRFSPLFYPFFIGLCRYLFAALSSAWIYYHTTSHLSTPFFSFFKKVFKGAAELSLQRVPPLCQGGGTSRIPSPTVVHLVVIQAGRRGQCRTPYGWYVVGCTIAPGCDRSLELYCGTVMTVPYDYQSGSGNAGVQRAISDRPYKCISGAQGKGAPFGAPGVIIYYGVSSIRP